jgi:hypothetical protein
LFPGNEQADIAIVTMSAKISIPVCFPHFFATSIILY